MLLVALVALFVTAGAQAVHDTGIFQLDRNAQASDDAGTVSATHDWDQICKAAGLEPLESRLRLRTVLALDAVLAAR